MIWWLRVHRTLPLLGLTTALAVLSIALGPIGMLFPSFGDGAPFALIPVAAVLPLVIAITDPASWAFALPVVVAAIVSSLAHRSSTTA
ncbi:hypothetical protein DEJ17_15945 [Curtobacterium sp. MCSS17_011]|uniref:hypothetical protein n=1 Tax=Curtobacterium sp. MCSS17_011 TaxID=2175643 RepID=UPI000D9EC67C|nr:hypothetical protein [Curtobacterium sp. MCSS17_011]PYY52552.1 hypothetical protein DEJ17_15945 [Curtobacterium sp. MCSS17_011]